MPNLTPTLQGEDKVTIEDIASDLFTDDIGVPYTDLLAVGANPTATIFRDGTVIGSTDNGTYTRWVNGDLEMSIVGLTGLPVTTVAGSIFQSASITWNYPIASIVNTVTNGNDSLAAFWFGSRGATTSAVLVARYHASVGSAYTINATAKGTWK